MVLKILPVMRQFIFPRISDADEKGRKTLEHRDGAIEGSYSMLRTKILLLSEDVDCSASIQEAFASLNIQADIRTQYRYIIDDIKNNIYDIILFDAMLSNKSKTGFMSQMHVLSSASKVILIVDSNNKEKSLNALHAGVYDLLEKPFPMKLLVHKVAKALEIQEAETELHDLRSQLRALEQECLELNKALSFIARNAERRQQEEKQQLILRMRSLMLPLLRDISKDKNMEVYESQFALLLQYLDGLHSDIPSDFRALQSLSSRELRVVTMIKQGLTNVDIADQLRISPQTVKTHRRNIRKKLGAIGIKSRLHTILPQNTSPTIH